MLLIVGRSATLTQDLDVDVAEVRGGVAVEGGVEGEGGVAVHGHEAEGVAVHGRVQVVGVRRRQGGGHAPGVGVVHLVLRDHALGQARGLLLLPGYEVSCGLQAGLAGEYALALG